MRKLFFFNIYFLSLSFLRTKHTAHMVGGMFYRGCNSLSFGVALCLATDIIAAVKIYIYIYLFIIIF